MIKDTPETVENTQEEVHETTDDVNDTVANTGDEVINKTADFFDNAKGEFTAELTNKDFVFYNCKEFTSDDNPTLLKSTSEGKLVVCLFTFSESGLKLLNAATADLLDFTTSSNIVVGTYFDDKTSCSQIKLCADDFQFDYEMGKRKQNTSFCTSWGAVNFTSQSISFAFDEKLKIKR